MQSLKKIGFCVVVMVGVLFAAPSVFAYEDNMRDPQSAPLTPKKSKQPSKLKRLKSMPFHAAAGAAYGVFTDKELKDSGKGTVRRALSGAKKGMSEKWNKHKQSH